jgi:uncharacterized small protein (DUF1192 family)
MPLVKSNQIPCDCVPEHLGCVVLRSKYKIPRPIKSDLYELITVTTLDGRIEFPQQEITSGKYNKYKKVNNLKPYYTVINEYLYLIGVPNNNLNAVLVNMVLEDPTEADMITLCDEDGNETDDTCFDPRKDTFQLDGHLYRPLIYRALTEHFNIPKSSAEDITNDTLSVEPNKRY